MRNLLGLTMSLYKDVQELKFGIGTLKEVLSKQVSCRWVDSRQVMEALQIGKRKLQSLRDKGVLPFSLMEGKFYYRISDLLSILESGYVKGKGKSSGTL